MYFHFTIFISMHILTTPLEKSTNITFPIEGIVEKNWNILSV